MKKVTKLCIFGMAAMLLLAGCSAEKSAPADNASTSSNAAPRGAKKGSIKLGEYKGVEIGKYSYDVTDEELDQQIQSIMTANPTYAEVERAAELGDTVNIDYEGKKDGVAFQGGTSKGSDLELGSGSFIEGFEEGLVGAKAGDKVVLDLTFPENYPSEELAGAAVVFDVTVNSVKEKKDAELNDEFVQGISDFKTVAEFKEDTKKDLTDNKKMGIDQQRAYEALQAVVANSEIVCSQKDLDEAYDNQVAYYTNMASSYGMTLEDMAPMLGGDMESFYAELSKYAQQAVEQKMVVDAVAKKEKLEVTDADRKALAEEYQTDMMTLINQAGKENVDEAAITKKVGQFLADNAVEVEKETEAPADSEETTAEAETTAAQ